MSKTVICQKWEESERGWGVRPDGYTLHRSEADRVRFVEKFWQRQRAAFGASAPDEYTRESGKAYECPVSDAIYDVITDDGVWDHELRRHGLISQYGAPWPGGSDGWRSADPPRLA